MPQNVSLPYMLLGRPLVVVLAFLAPLFPASFGVAQVDRYDLKDLIAKKLLDERGKEVWAITVPGKPPDGYRAPVADPPVEAVTLSTVPAFDWSFGCSATSAAMIAGHYDNLGYPNMYTGPANGGVMPMNNSRWGSVVIGGETRKQCPLSATRFGLDGRTSRGHVDDYWVRYDHPGPDPYIVNRWNQHAYGDCTGDYLKTNQSAFGLSDGSTLYYFYVDGSPYSGTRPDDGCYGLRLFFESRGYRVESYFTQLIEGYGGNTVGFKFSQYKQEIDAGRPVMIQVEGHSMVGYGYDAASSTVYLHDTWDYSSHSMTWGGRYCGLGHWGVGVYRLAPPGNVRVTSPNGGEHWVAGLPYRITWTSSGITTLTADYTTDNGVSWHRVAPNGVPAAAGFFDWTVPNTPSAQCKVRLTGSNSNPPGDTSDALFTISSPTPGNMIRNPGFEAGTANWSFSPAGAGSFTTAQPGYTGRYAGSVFMSASGSQGELKQTGLSLFSGVQYRVKFMAKSNSVRDTLTIGLLKNTTPGTVYWGPVRFPVGSGWTACEKVLKTRSFLGKAADLKLSVAFGADAGDQLRFDDFLVELVIGCTAPGITDHPASRTVAVGQTATFGVTATGTTPLRYQWQKDGVDINGATMSSYTTPVAAWSDNRSLYRCVVGNSCGSVTSNAATLTVTPAGMNVIQNPGFESGTTSWAFYTDGSGSFAAVSPGAAGAKAGRVAITTAGTNVQLYQTGFPLEANKPYRLTFRAYSTGGHDLSASVSKHTSPYTAYGLSGRVFDLSGGWSTYTIDFTTTGFTGTTTDTRLRFWLAPYDANGDLFFFDEVTLEKRTAGGLAAAGGETHSPLEMRSGDYGLRQNYPNPFNPATTLIFDLPEPSRVSVRVFSALGEEVAVLREGLLEAGRHTVVFDATSRAGGVYFCRFEAHEARDPARHRVQTIKMIYLR